MKSQSMNKSTSTSTTTNGISTTDLRKNTKAWAVEQGGRRRNLQQHNQKVEGVGAPSDPEHARATGRARDGVRTEGGARRHKGGMWRGMRGYGREGRERITAVEGTGPSK